MSSTMLLERGLFGGQGASPNFAPSTPGNATNWCVVPKCEITCEPCKDGFKICCCCDDDVACATLQNLCDSLAGGLCSCCCTLNGIQVFQCCLALGICKCEKTKNGCCITCTSGDKTCCEIIKKCCDCICSCLKAGCCCYVCFNNTPVCCGCCN